MRSLGWAVAAAAFLAAPAVRADVTIRYKSEIKSSVPMPTGVADMGNHAIRMKGNKGYMEAGGFTMMVDFARRECTIVDPAGRKYATIPAAEYGKSMASAMPEMPPGAAEAAGATLGAMKSKTDSRKTGRTETIQGVAAEEREITFQMEMPMPEASGMPPMTMKMVMQVWAAKQGEALRVPAIRELSGFNLWQKYFLNPTDTFGKMVPQMGGMASLFEEMQKDQSVVLRMHMSMYMPSMEALVARMSGQPGRRATAGAEAETPFMEMSQEVVELSTAPVDEALFRIPEGFAAASFGELMNGMMEAQKKAAKPAPPAIPEAHGGGKAQAYVPRLTPVKQSEPVRPEGMQGAVEVLITLDPKGNVADAEALGGPEGLRKPAVDTVKQWTFRPVMRDGQAVTALTNASVYFGDPQYLNLGATEILAVQRRREQLEEALPRTPEQELADLEQDSGGGDSLRRYNALDELSKLALKAGAEEKAAAYANELLQAAKQHEKDWNYGNAIHDGHSTLGLIAVRRGDLVSARQHLLDAGATPGSPQLNSFGPDMTLASELLKKGERNAVLDYFALCRNFWKMGGQRLDAWSETVHNGGTPAFGVNLR